MSIKVKGKKTNEILNISVETEIPNGINEKLTLPWETKITKSQKLDILNQEDFQINETLHAMGISASPLVHSFGLSARAKDEISNRIHLCTFLMENPELRMILQESYVSNFPHHPQDVVDYNTKQGYNPYWTTMNKIFKALKNAKGVAPTRVLEFLNWIEKTNSMETVEEELLSTCQEVLEKVISVEGLLRFSISDIQTDYPDIELEEEESWGYQTFGAQYGKDTEKEYPGWIYNDNFITKFAGGFFVDFKKRRVNQQNEKIRKEALKGQVFTEIPEDVKRTVVDAIERKLKRFKWDVLENIYEDSREISKLSAIIHFHYTPSTGLCTEVLQISDAEFEAKELTFTLTESSKFSKSTKKKITKAQEQVKKSFVQIQNLQDMSKLVGILAQKELFKQETHSSKNLDITYKRTLANLLWETNLMETRKFCELHRVVAEEIITNLRNVAQLVSDIIKKGEEHGFPVTLPKINWTKNTSSMSFEKIYPIQLIGRPKPAILKQKGEIQGRDLIPILDLPNLDQSLIGFTGRHGEGKSTILEAFVNYLYLAQSGIPLFGEDIHLSLHNMLGMIFLSRGDGSTIQIYMQKATELIKYIKAKGNKALVVMDEVGTGTQEQAGAEFGKKVIRKLQELGANVVFSTQITEMAQELSDCASILQVNKNHEIRQGIGTGELDQLMNESGLTELLEN